ncbi:MAG: hypothetical protein M1838_000064 [Thelocarpon superellum]|nr:MAG: hypothetical protein M1838_000064 [Thelocarpon superellum]
MALVMASASPDGHDSPRARVSRVTEMLNDVEKQIKQYILEQRARERSEAAEPQTPPPLLPRTTYSPFPSSSARSPPRLPASKLAIPQESPRSDDIPLDLIFNTPQTQISPARSPARCELSRRGATLLRVDSATADANDLRSQQWSRESNEQDERLHPGPDLRDTDRSVIPNLPSPPASVTGGGLAMPTAPRTPASQHRTGPVPPLTPPSARLNDGARRRSRSLSHIKPAPLKLEPLPPAHLRSISACQHAPNMATAPATANATSSSTNLSSKVQPPIPTGIEHDRRRSAPTSPTLLMESPTRSPPSLFLQDGSLRRTILVDHSDRLNEALRFDERLARPLLPSPKELGPMWQELPPTPRSEAPSKMLDPRKWLPTKHTMSPKRAESAAKSKAKTKVKQEKRSPSKRPGHARKWTVGEGMTELLSRRMFSRLEVDEMIDTSALSPRRVSARTEEDEDVRTAGPRELSRRTATDRAFGQQLALPRGKLALTAAAVGLRRVPVSTQGNPRGSGLGPNHLRVASAEPPRVSGPVVHHQRVASAHTPRMKPTGAQPNLFTITESAPAQIGDRDGMTWAAPTRPPRPSNGQLPETRRSRADLPVLVGPWPLSPTFVHGPIRLELSSPQEPQMRKSSTDTLDWTAFQMAISGPTGDYLMGGDTSSDQVVDNDVAEWFTSYGFTSEGRMVEHDEVKETDEEAESPSWSPPVELPALDSTATSARTSAMRVEGDDYEKQVVQDVDELLGAGKMSANLNDLGDYLSFETYHVGATDDA